MGIASSMRNLAQNIASSHEDRTKAVLEIREEAERVTGDAQDLIKGFQTSRSQSGAQLRKDLAKDKASRESDVKKMLGGFQASRREEDAQLRKELAQGVAGRRSEVNAILEDAQQAIRTLQSQRKEAGSKLREELAQSRSSCKSEVKELLKDLGKSRQETGEKLRDDLARARADSESAVKAIKAEVNEMRTGFRNSRTDVIGDINEARAAWQELTRVAKKTTVKTAPGNLKGKAKKAAAGPEEGPDLETKLLAAINAHPEGITLAEVAESMGVVPIVLGRVSRKLLNEAKIRKDDKLYFPVTGE